MDALATFSYGLLHMDTQVLNGQDLDLSALNEHLIPQTSLQNITIASAPARTHGIPQARFTLASDAMNVTREKTAFGVEINARNLKYFIRHDKDSHTLLQNLYESLVGLPRKNKFFFLIHKST